jgi:methyl-accepting chemotaxis protein
MTAVGLLAVAGLTLAARSFTDRMAESAEELSRIPAAIRGASFADMHHDAMYGVVLGAVVDGSPAAAQTAGDDLAESGAAFVAELERAENADVSPEVADAVEAVLPDVALYVGAGQAVLDAVANGEPTEGLMADFDATFAVLEESLPGIADAVETANTAALADANNAASASRRWTTLVAAAGALTLAIFSIVLARSITTRVKRTADVLGTVADGNLSERIEVTGNDELSDMARALNNALDNLSSAMAIIDQHSSTLAAASHQLTSVSADLAGAADDSSTRALRVASAAEQVSDSVGVVSIGTDEMNAAIQDISRAAHDAVSVADQAGTVARQTDATVAKLGVSSAEIDTVIQTITQIAEKTNLLALNATIEAARAGEAGQGFAVVAHEVKDLAAATTAATADISSRISSIQVDAADSVRAIKEINEIIGRVAETQSSIAAAVEEQTATTGEIGRNVALASVNSGEIAQNIATMATAAGQASETAGATLETATELSRVAGELQSIVGSFRR